MATAQPIPRETPKDISFDSIVVDVHFHPHKDIIVAGDIDGDITLHSYSTTEDNHEVMTLTHHKKACRCVRFSPEGKILYSASKDKSVCAVDMDQGKLIHNITQAHSCPLYTMHVADENIVATGDDEGTLKVWDMRQEKAVMEMKENDDFISDMSLDNKKRVLLATSGDGTLTAFDIRKHKMKLQSELFDSEMLSLAVVKKGEKVVCGNGEGSLNIFNWGEWGNISDRFPGHPMSIDCMVAYNEDIVFTGSFDGIIRAVNILPNRFMGVVGEHPNFPVENMTLSHCRTFLASCSHDQTIKFWKVEGIEDEEVDTKHRAKKTTKTKILNKAKAKDDFFAELAGQTDKKDDDEEKDKDGDDDENDDEAGDSDDDNDEDLNSDITDDSNDNDSEDDSNEDHNDDRDDAT